MKKEIVSVITVVYNAVDTIRETVESVLGQSYGGIEYVVIDGGSTDGTLAILREYGSRIDVLVSEPDDGIYHAMNKGIDLAKGDWIVFMNSGDVFCDSGAIDRVFMGRDIPSNTDVIYGNSIRLNRRDNEAKHEPVSSPAADLLKYPVYRHGSSFVRATTHRLHKFQVSLKGYGFALDYKCIYDMYQAGRNFFYVDSYIMTYDTEGLSNRPIRTMWYQYRITHPRMSLQGLAVFGLKTTARAALLNPVLRPVVRTVYLFFKHYVMNRVVAFLPAHSLRKSYYRRFGMRLKRGSVINMGLYLNNPENIEIGKNTHINRNVFLDGRNQIKIGNSVSISHGVSILTGTHDVQSAGFRTILKPVEIGDHAWIGINAVILPGVKIGQGAVVAAGAVVSKDVIPFEIVGGVPARRIGERKKGLDYICRWELPFI